MDLSDITIIEEAPMVLVDPETGDEVKNNNGDLMTIWCVGKDSKKFDQYQGEIYSDVHKSKKPFTPYGEAKKRKIGLLVHCTTRFENLFSGGKELEYSEKAARILYKTQPWIREQVDAFIGDRSNFLSRGAKD